MSANKHATAQGRLQAVDALRGLIMLLMALDHANIFIAQQHSSGEYWGGAFPQYRDVLSFLTRFITHPVAPGFAFMMGVGMVLFTISRRQRDWQQWQVVRHFVIRGSLLILLQFTVVNWAWSQSPTWRLEYYFGVLFALGGGMIIGSLLLGLRPSHLLALTIVLLIGNELLTPAATQWGQWQSLPVHATIIAGGDGRAGWWVNYPILQWLEFIIFGMVFGHWFATDKRQAFRRAGWLSLALLAGFVVVRFFDGFGNIRPRSGDDWIAFLNVVKYPPSIAFTLLMMGINLGLLALFARFETILKNGFRLLVVYGRTPLLFYICHLWLYAGIGTRFPDGTSLAQMYPLWLLGLVLLFPVCWLYGRFKQRTSQNSLWRIL